MNLSERLEDLRKQHDLTQDQLAEKLTVTRQAISRWERGLAYPTVDNLKALAQLYQVSLDTLLLDEPPKPVEPAPAAVPEPTQPAPTYPPRGRLALTLAWVAAVLALLIISFAAAVGKAPDPNPETAYTVTAPYDYPVLPGTAEWAKLQTLEEKIQACAVEESLMRSMTTQALLETVVRYPLLANIYAFDHIEDGLASVGAYFPGLDLLMQRADLDTCIQQALESRPDSVLEEGYLHILQNYQPAP